MTCALCRYTYVWVGVEWSVGVWPCACLPCILSLLVQVSVLIQNIPAPGPLQGSVQLLRLPRTIYIYKYIYMHIFCDARTWLHIVWLLYTHALVSGTTNVAYTLTPSQTQLNITFGYLCWRLYSRFTVTYLFTSKNIVNEDIQSHRGRVATTNTCVCVCEDKRQQLIRASCSW